MQWGKLLKFIGLSKATPLEKIEQAVIKGRMPSLFADNISGIKNPEIRQGLSEYVSIFAKSVSGKSQGLKAQADDVIYKLNLCDDIKIKAEAEELLSSLAGKKKKEGRKIITKAENLLDSVNTAEEKYCTLYSTHAPIGTFINYNKFCKKIKKQLLKKFTIKDKNNTIENLHQLDELRYSEPRKIARFAERRGDKIPNDVLRNENRFNSLREFMELNPNDKETATYLWKKYFLSHQDTGTQKILREIYDEFGTRICFVDKNLDRAKLYYVREEFRMWNKACSGEAKFPGLLDIRNDYKVLKHEHGGCCSQRENAMLIGYNNVIGKGYRYNALRHEMGHLNDSNLEHSAVKKSKKTIIKKELKNAGMESHYKYAFKNNAEKKAVACEANMEALSQEFKDEIVREGLHPGVVNLRPVSYAKARLYNKLRGTKNEKLINELEKTFGGTIPDDIVHAFDSSDIKYIKSILKNLKEGEVLTTDSFMKALKSKQHLGNIKEYERFLEKMQQKIIESNKNMMSDFEKAMKEQELKLKEIEKEIAMIKEGTYLQSHIIEEQTRPRKKTILDMLREEAEYTIQ